MEPHLADPQGELSKADMAFVLFTDIVEYSLRSMREQKSVRNQLKEMALQCEALRVANKPEAIIRRSTGDGIALVFFVDPEAPLRCAIELSQKLKRCPTIKVRMGIHSGPVYRDTDINEQADVSGPGINTAQRVMDLGDGGHILTSRAFAEFLLQLDDWKAHVFELGEGKDKHDNRVHLYNFYNDDVGNPEVPVKLRSQSRGKTLAVSANPGATGSGGEDVSNSNRREQSNLEPLRSSKSQPVRRNRYHSCGMLLPGEGDFCVHCGGQV